MCRVSWTRDRPPLSLRIGWAGPTATWAEGTHATMNITASRPHASPRIARVDEGTVVSRETCGELGGIRPVCCIPPPFHVKHAVATPPDSAASQRHLRATHVRVQHQAILDATPLPSPVHLTPSRGRRTQPHPPRWFSSCWACRSARRSASCSLGRPSHASARHPSWSTGPLGVITSMPSIGADAGSGSAGLTTVGLLFGLGTGVGASLGNLSAAIEVPVVWHLKAIGVITERLRAGGWLSRRFDLRRVHDHWPLHWWRFHLAVRSGSGASCRNITGAVDMTLVVPRRQPVGRRGGAGALGAGV